MRLAERKKTIKIKTNREQKKNRKKISKTRNYFFRKSNKINKLLGGLKKKKEI